MNERITELYIQARQLAKEATDKTKYDTHAEYQQSVTDKSYDTFAELIVAECVNREALLGAIARGWCSEKNSHKTMDPDLAVAIYDQVEQQIRQQFGVEE